MSEIRVDTHEDRGIVVIDVEGRIDAFLVTKIREVINDLVQEGKVKLVIRFEKVSQINSTALGILVGRLRRVRIHGGDIKIVGLSPEIQRIFDVMGASRIFNIYADIEGAKQAFEKPLFQTNGDSPAAAPAPQGQKPKP